MNSRSATPSLPSGILKITFAWVVMLAVSDVPDIILTTLSMEIPPWLAGVKLVFLVTALVVCSYFAALKPLFGFIFIMLVLFSALSASAWLSDLPGWQNLFANDPPSFFIGYLEAFLRDIGVAAAVVFALWLLLRRRESFFLVRGSLDAPIEPVRWLGIGSGESWRIFGWIFAGIAFAAVLIPVVIDVQPSPELILRVVPLLPAAILFAAINALTEEIYFRAGILSTLTGVIGRRHTLLICATFFGLAHYLYGSPPGLAGLLMTGFLGWLLGKSMLETKGIGWAWFIHFIADLPIFFLYGLLWMRA